jgi:hypothetical protein
VAPSVKYETADRLACEPAAETGKRVTTAVTARIRERLERVQGAVPQEPRAETLEESGRPRAVKPVRDRRSPDDIVGGRLLASGLTTGQTVVNTPPTALLRELEPGWFTAFAPTAIPDDPCRDREQPVRPTASVSPQ